jgi:hypothetical protein
MVVYLPPMASSETSSGASSPASKAGSGAGGSGKLSTGSGSRGSGAHVSGSSGAAAGERAGRPAIHPITNPKSWAVLVAPVRLELVEVMRMIAPCSIKEIAAALDRPADTLYRHVEKLRRIGVVTEAGVRRSGRRFEQVFDLVADDFRPGFREVSPRAANKAYNETVQSILKVASRTARDSAAANQLVGMGDERNLIGKIEHAWLSHSEFLAVRAMMMGIKEFMDARKGRREGRLYLAAVVAMPVTRKRGARTRNAREVAKPAREAAKAAREAGKAAPKGGRRS